MPGWDYENVMGDTTLREDYVFVTKTHDHAAADAVWLVKRYEPEHYLVQYYKIEPGQKVGIIEVHCFELGKSLTRVEVTYEYIGMSDSGNAFVESFSQEVYEAFIGEWKILIEEHFERSAATTQP